MKRTLLPRPGARHAADHRTDSTSVPRPGLFARQRQSHPIDRDDAPTPPRQPHATYFACALFACALLDGCTHLVPDATPPQVTVRDDQGVFRAPDVVVPAVPVIAPAASMPADSTAATETAPWWHRLGQPALAATVDEALARNPGLDGTEKQLAAARHVLQAAIGNATLPSVDLGADASRTRGPGIPTIGPAGTLQKSGTAFYDDWSTFVSASYDVDLFGATRLDNETRRKQVDTEAAQRDAARLALASRVATTTITLSALQAQWQNAVHTAALSDADLETTLRRAALGAVNDDAVLSARMQADSAHAAVAAVETQRATARHALAALLGRTPDAAPQPLPFDAHRDPGSNGNRTLAPSDAPMNRTALDSTGTNAANAGPHGANGADIPIPTVVPSELLAQRPDIRAATAALQGSAMAVGVARAAMLPQLKLTARLGRGGFLQPDLLSGPAWIWSAAAQLSAPLFHGGALREQVRGAQQTFEASKAQYRQTVLQAFQQVADALSALDADRTRIDALEKRTASAERSTDRQREKARLGAVPTKTVRAAEQQALSAERDLIDARATQWQDLIKLYEAIGATVPAA